MSSQRFSGDAIGRVAVSFLLGVIIGNLLWLPYTGASAIGLVFGAIVLAAPLALIAALVAGFADGIIKRRLVFWCLVAALLVTIVYALFDPPIDRDGAERVAIALTCSAASAVTFFVLTKRARA